MGLKTMGRKAYSEQEREQVRTALLTTVIQCIVDRGLIHSSIDVLCKKVGISKTFFYTFFPSKEELVLEALRYPQPKREVVANNEERKVFTMENQIFMRINEVTKELGVFVPYAYKLIWQMNEELTKT